VKYRILIRHRAPCQECRATGYVDSPAPDDLIPIHVTCSVCAGRGDHPFVLVIPCVDLEDDGA
jgi:hypothetical protein